MTRIRATLEETFHVAAPPATVRDHFANLDAISRAIETGDRFEQLGDGQLLVVGKTQRHGSFVFEPRYVVRYAVEQDDVLWHTVGEGNVGSEGSAQFRPAPNGTRIHYRHAMHIDVPLDGLLARVLARVAAPILRRSIRQYVHAMIGSLRTS